MGVLLAESGRVELVIASAKFAMGSTVVAMLRRNMRGAMRGAMKRAEARRKVAMMTVF